MEENHSLDPCALRSVPSAADEGRDAEALPLGSAGAVLDAIPAELAILDAEGRVLATNAAWRHLEALAGAAVGRIDAGEGRVLERGPAEPVDSKTRDVARGIRKVARGAAPELRFVYPSVVGGELRWFRLRAIRFVRRQSVRVLVFHDEITESKRAERTLEELTEDLLVAQDDERRRIAREIHDATVPNLVGLSLNLARLVRRVRGELRSITKDCAALCEASLRDLRTSSFLLHPPGLERVGLVAALHWLVEGFGRRSGIALTLATASDRTERLAPAVELALYRIAQEALVNVHRHAAARVAHVGLTVDSGEVRLIVSDEGLGARSGFEGGGVGVRAMRERIEALGGHLDIQTSSAGTAVTATLRLQAP